VHTFSYFFLSFFFLSQEQKRERKSKIIRMNSLFISFNLFWFVFECNGVHSEQNYQCQREQQKEQTEREKRMEDMVLFSQHIVDRTNQ
jgi:hypothetical protein